MKLSRLAAGGAGIALVAASVLAGATAASADDFYVTADQIGTEVSTYPGYPATWFTGLPAPTTAPVSGPAGLTITPRTMLLNGAVPAGLSLTDLADGLWVDATSNVALQIPIFATPSATPATTPGTNFTSLISDDEGATWRSSSILPGVTTTTHETVTIAQVVAVYPTPTILAYGALASGGPAVTIHSVWDGVNTHYFTPRPTLTVTPSPVTPADFAAAGKGVTVMATGFIPGEEVYAAAVAPNGDDWRENTGTADANGAVSITIVWDGIAPVDGTYELYVSSETNFIYGTFEVKKALAATGLDTTSTLLLGGLMLAAGAGVAVMAIRRKSSQA